MLFMNSPYGLAVIAKHHPVIGQDGIINEVKSAAKFSYSDLTYEEFNLHYSTDGWQGRKIKALYMFFWTGIIRTIYHVFKGVLARVNTSISDSNDDQLKFKLFSLKHFYIACRDLQEGFGWVITLFNDYYGSFYTEEARFHKTCYEYFKKIDSMVSASPISHSITDPLEKMLVTRREETEKIRCPIALETGRATTEGFYKSPSGRKIYLSSGDQLLERSKVIPNSILDCPMDSKYDEPEIIVINQDCLEAAKEEIRNGARKVAVLMFSSPIEPGGAMEEGNNGQEEDLCRRSDIFGFMWDQARFNAKTLLYNLVDVSGAHQVDPQYSLMTNNRMIHVPQVTVFRSGKKDDYKMLENPFEIGMLVSPALDRPGYEKVEGQMRYKRAEDEEQLRKLLMTQLKVSYEENYDTVILGAFGCGAFYNPPELIAKFYKEIIDAYFKGAFKKIVFAILDDESRSQHNPEGNFKPFQKCFETSNAHMIPKKENVDLFVSMAGNPSHMGHMHMIALAVNRLVAEGYSINEVKVALSGEAYLKDKVYYCNLSISKHKESEESEEKQEMLKVLLSRAQRIKFLQEAIKDAKNKKVFNQDLNINYFDNTKNSLFDGKKVFHVCGADLAEDMCNFGGEQGDVKHAVIVTREGKSPKGISESHTNNYSRLIVNNDSKTSLYSSSKIQNGAYEQLPEAVQDEFKELHESAQHQAC